ncbi:serine incorporator/TMS membrane protein, partial [Amylostereum chailletii]
ATITMTGVLYAYFAVSGCTLNRFFITFNLILSILITVVCVHPIIQEHNPRSGLAQSSMVAVYCTYLVMSAVGNHAHETCNPFRKGGAGEGARTTAVVLGALFTFLAIAYSTSRAATQSRALVGKKNGGAVHLGDEENHEVSVVNNQPSRTETPRYQALLAAVEAGAIPASALNEHQEEDDDDDDEGGDTRDDERTGTRYNYSWFHIIFVLGAMYVAMLLTDWNVVKSASSPVAEGDDVYIGRSETAMWMRIVSSWVCMVIYLWSLLAPVLFPDRFVVTLRLPFRY